MTTNTPRPSLPPQPGLGPEAFAAYAAYLGALAARLSARSSKWAAGSTTRAVADAVLDLTRLVRDMAERTVK
mgnify:FL=1